METRAKLLTLDLDPNKPAPDGMVTVIFAVPYHTRWGAGEYTISGPGLEAGSGTGNNQRPGEGTRPATPRPTPKG